MEINGLKERTVHGTVIFPLAGYRWKGGTKNSVCLHWHTETEIIFLEKGVFNIKIDMNEYSVEAPAFAFINAGEIHSLLLEENQKESAVVFDLKMLSFEYFDGIQYDIIKPLLEQRLQFPRFIYRGDPARFEIQKLYMGILRDAEHPKQGSKLRVKAFLYQILAILYERNYLVQHGDIEKTGIARAENIKKVLGFIQERYAYKITVHKIADLAGMNPQYFCRYFKKATGKTLTEYINEVRLEKAAEMLLKTDEKVITIAESCGYDNISYFTKRFKNAKGFTPQEYRRQKSK